MTTVVLIDGSDRHMGYLRVRITLLNMFSGRVIDGSHRYMINIMIFDLLNKSSCESNQVFGFVRYMLYLS